MKTYKVDVTYLDAQPEGEFALTETYVVQAEDEFHAERLGMEKAARTFWSYEPLEAMAQEYCPTCQNTGMVSDGLGDGHKCEDCRTKPVDESAHLPQTRHEAA